MRILHLGFEDHRRPGSGGGSARNREINSRLGARHEITVLTAHYDGARERVEDGVRYVPIGGARGYYGDILTYFAALPRAVRRHPSDVIVEEFAAPFASSLVPLWSRRPIVGHVQWLFAGEKSRQYRVPFFLVEAAGVRAHRRMIAISPTLGRELARRNPGAEVTVIGPGVDEAALRLDGPKGSDLLYLGRLEVHQKGLDLLLEAFAAVAGEIGNRLVIAGDGPDRSKLERRIGELALGGRVVLVGRKDGGEKHELLRRAQIVCMPSRYETLGLVAYEAFAAGTPVLTFDIPCLTDHVTSERGATVPRFDVAAFAAELRALALDDARCARLGAAGRTFVAGLRWDDVARRQEEVYEAALRDRRPGLRQARR